MAKSFLIFKELAFSWASALSQVLESLQALLLDTSKILSGVKKRR
jgi:hypothetical protein